MGAFLQDLRFGVRTLIRNPPFLIVSVLTLALAIGGNTAVFSVVEAVLLRPLPYPEGERLVELVEGDGSGGMDALTAADFTEIQRGTSVFEGAAAVMVKPLELSGPDGDDRVAAAVVSEGFFRVLGTPALVGRTFGPEDAADRAARLTVLDEGLWRRGFGGDPAIVGRPMELDGEPAVVVGVVPERAGFPREAEVWQLSVGELPNPPVELEDAARQAREVGYLRAIARRRPEVGLAAVTAELEALSTRLAEAFPATNADRVFRALDLRERLVGDVRTPLMVLMGAVLLVLLVACANLTNMLLARATARRRELAVRTALGASGTRIGRQLLTESLLVGVLGGSAGVLLALWLVPLLASRVPADVPRIDEVGLNPVVLAFAVLLTLLSGVAVGVLPALQQARPAEVLRAEAPGAGGGRGLRRLRSLLVAGQIAVALVLVSTAGLFLQSLRHLGAVDPGFRMEGLLEVPLALSPARYPTPAERTRVYQELAERAAEVPGVAGAAYAFPGPLSGGISGTLSVEGSDPASRQPVAQIATVTPGYRSVLGLRLIAGRDFRRTDDADAPGVALVSRRVAESQLPGVDPVGRRIRFGEEEEDWLTIVGVVEDARTLSLDREPPLQIYIPTAQFSVPFGGLYARVADDAGDVANALRAAALGVDAEFTGLTVRTVAERAARESAAPRFRSGLLGLLAGLALVLAAVGTYGVISYTVSERTRELGIRMALGAERPAIRRMVVGQGLAVATAGALVGLAGALAVGRAVSDLLFEVRPWSPTVLLGSAALLLLVAAAASWGPARRATAVDPITVIRAE